MGWRTKGLPGRASAVGISCASICALIMMVLVFAPADAAAQNKDRAEIMRLVGEGNKHYDQAQFQQALSDYLDAYELSKESPLLYRIGQCYENIGNYQRAREYMELFLLSDPQNKRAPRIRAKVKMLRGQETKLQARVELRSVPAGATIYLNDLHKAEGVTPLSFPVGTGTQKIVAKAKGYDPLVFTFEPRPGKTVRKKLTFKEGKATDETPEDPGEEPEVPPKDDEPTISDKNDGNKQDDPPRDLPVIPVDISPPAIVSVLCWTGVAMGNVLLLTGIIGPRLGNTGQRNVGATVGAMLGGLTLLGVSGYFLVGYDYGTELPPPSAAPIEGANASRLGTPLSGNVSLQWSLRF